MGDITTIFLWFSYDFPFKPPLFIGFQPSHMAIYGTDLENVPSFCQGISTEKVPVWMSHGDKATVVNGGSWWLPSGKRLQKTMARFTIFICKSTIFMVMFNSYVELPEGKSHK